MASIDPQIAALVAHIEESADGRVLAPVGGGLQVHKAGMGGYRCHGGIPNCDIDRLARYWEVYRSFTLA